MFDYIVYYKINEVESDRIVSLDEYIEDKEMLEELLLEELREYFEIDDIELISYESLVDREVDVENIE